MREARAEQEGAALNVSEKNLYEAVPRVQNLGAAENLGSTKFLKSLVLC